MKDQTKLFAFKLAEKSPQTKWSARKGVAIAGCTLRPGTRFGIRYGDDRVFC